MSSNAVQDIDAAITEYDLSMAHADICELSNEIEIISSIVDRIYRTWPETFNQTDQIERTIARITRRILRARNRLEQELRAHPINGTAAPQQKVSGNDTPNRVRRHGS